MKDIKTYIFESYFDEQDKFIENMIKVWKSKKYKELNKFDLYFKWKNHEINTDKLKSEKKLVRKMWDESEELLNDLYDNNSKENELIDILKGVNAELETINLMLH